MNMKMEEHEAEMQKNKKVPKNANNELIRSRAVSEGGEKGVVRPDTENMSESGSEFGKGDRMNDYEQMLQKYEAEVRNHIKIE